MPFRNPITTLGGILTLPALQSPDYSYHNSSGIMHISGWSLYGNDAGSRIDVEEGRFERIYVNGQSGYDPGTGNAAVINLAQNTRTLNTLTKYNYTESAASTSIASTSSASPTILLESYYLSMSPSTGRVRNQISMDCNMILFTGATAPAVGNYTWLRVGYRYGTIGSPFGPYTWDCFIPTRNGVANTMQVVPILYATTYNATNNNTIVQFAVGAYQQSTPNLVSGYNYSQLRVTNTPSIIYTDIITE